MYLSFYQLNKEPFHITPDPEFLYLSPSHKQALGSVIYGIEQRKGFIAITGEVGVGKTTILRSYLDRAERERLKIIYVFNSNVSFGGLVKTIHRELGSIPREANNVYEMVDQLHAILIEEYRQDRSVALIIDEAQNMPIATLENLRMLSNLETSKDKLIQILLVGQPEFDLKLELHELRQLKQRIAIRCKILPLTREESLDYIKHRLTKASRKKKSKVFSRGALSLIVKHSKGIPRMLNVLCDNSLITGFGYDKKVISPKIVKEVIADFAGHPLGPWNRLKSWLIERPTAKENHETSFDATGGLDVLPEPRILRVVPKSNGIEPLMETFPSLSSVGKPPTHQMAGPMVAGDPKPMVDSGSDQGDSSAKKEGNGHASKINSRFSYRFFTQKGSFPTLVAEVYGYYNEELISMVKQANPKIQDFNCIKIGQIIRFPVLD
jgi:type II secretory pathway predicted ATPase ExeA